MRRAAILLVLLGLSVSLPASATRIEGETVIRGSRDSVALELRGFTARGVDRSVLLPANDLSDLTIDDFTDLDAGSKGGGSISIVGRLVETSYGRRSFVWVAGTPDSSAPIPEPSSALLFAVGTGLVVAWLRRS